MPRKKGWKSENSRDESLPVRLSSREKSTVQRNAKTASLDVSDFVRARILPAVQPGENLTAPTVGSPLSTKRSAITKALQRVLQNMLQLNPFVDQLKDDDLFDLFMKVDKSLMLLQSDHLNSKAIKINARSNLVSDLNVIGRSLNRIAAGASGVGEIKKPSRLQSVLEDLQACADRIEGTGK